jgi:pimeloyl-ACP methyl ester carboxylesterase
MTYKDIAPLLADEFRVIAMTTMGYGQSDRPSPPYEHLDQFATSVSQFLDALDIEKTSLFGTHTGSEIAAVFASKFPEKLDKLVLEEVFNWGTPSRRAVHERIHRYYEEKMDGTHLLELWEKVGGLKEGANLKLTTERFISNLIVNSDEDAEIYGGMGWEGAGPFAMTHHDMWETVEKIDAPTLVIHGTTSELGRSHEKFLTNLKRSRGINPPSQGNFTPHQAPEIWADEVRKFLREPGV